MAGSAKGRFHAVAGLADAVTQVIVPALQQQAAAEAGRNLAGTYHAPGGLNSTLVLATEEGAAGVLYNLLQPMFLHPLQEHLILLHFHLDRHPSLPTQRPIGIPPP